MDNYSKILVDIPPRAPMFSFEGIDGSGKSTQVPLVAAELNRLGIESMRVASPSHGVVGEFLRENLKKLPPWQRSTLFLMEMINYLVTVDPKVVLLWDRYTDSDIVSNKDLEPEKSALWVAALPKPQRTFLFDIDPKYVAGHRPESLHDHSLDFEWQNLKRQRYLKLAQSEPNRFAIIDATKPKEEITKEVTRQILSQINLRT